MENKQEVDWTNLIFMVSTPILAIGVVVLAGWVEGFSTSALWLFLGFYLLSGLSITAGYHRLFAHRAYAAHPVVRALLLFFAAGTFQNSALQWCANHRLHHSKVDTDHDPYNIGRGFFYAHMGWILLRPRPDAPQLSCPDLQRDPLVVIQHRFYLPLAVISGFALPTLVGWAFGVPLAGLAFGGLFRIVFVHHSTFLINSASHMWGTQPYTDTNTARDNWVTALLTYGEGYHNFHHYFQSDHRNGVLWYQYDPTKWLIVILKRIGLASNLKRTPEELVLRARLHMEAQRLQQKLPAQQESSHSLGPILSWAEALEAKLAQVQKLRHRMSEAAESHSLQEIKRGMKQLLAEYRADLRQWRNSYRRLIPAPSVR